MAKDNKAEKETKASKAEKASKKADKKKKKNNPFKSVAAFFKSTNAERKKVVWPSAKDTIKNAAIVLAVTLVVGVAIYGIDSLLTLGMKQVKSLADNTTVSAEADDSSNPDADIVEDDAESTTADEDTTAESTSAE
ncbi:MAG: preprotein translocase subunit SecE [Eubacterium sp.]